MVPTECPRTTTDTPLSPSVAVNIDFRGYLQFLCIGLNFSYREKEKGGLCSKFRTVDTDVDPCRGEIKKKGMHFRSPNVRRGGEISNKMQP